MKSFLVFGALLLAASSLTSSAQVTSTDEGGRVLGLENAWNHAIEAKDARALDMLLADSFVAIDIDGSISNKNDFLAGIVAPKYQPSKAVYEKIQVQMYGEAAVTNGIFRVTEIVKGKSVVRRERFIDTWVKKGQSWQCVASQVTLIPAK